MWGQIAAGAAAGIAANEGQRHIDQKIHGDRRLESLFHELKTAIHELCADLHVVADHYRKLGELPIDETLLLQPDPTRVRLSTHGRRYNMIFVPVSGLTIMVNMPGVAPFSFSPVVGWIELDFKEGTELYLQSGGPVSVVYRCTHVALGANAV